MRTYGRFVRISALYLCPMIWSYTAHAADINGAWVTDKAVCNKIYVKKGNNVAFSKNADLFGSGFIIQGSAIKGKNANCKIKTTKQDGSTVHILAACSTDIMLSDTQFSLQMVDDDKLVRIFPGMPEMATHYFRCLL